MSVQKKEVKAPAQASIDEIDEIMNEIEELQHSMASSQATPAPKGSAAPEEPNVMEEFQAGSGDVSMEETLADLKDEEPSGPNLIDQAMQAEEAARAAEADELLDEAEAEALEEAIAEEEEAAIEEVSEPSEEKSAMSYERKRRGRSEPVQHAEVQRGWTSDASGSSAASIFVKIAGDTMLRLSYDYDGQEISIGFVDGALRIELSDGTEFKIPVRRNSLRKVA